MKANVESREFVAVDWGTSSFRLWHVKDCDNVIAHVTAPFGMSTIKKSEYGSILNEHILELDISPVIPVIVCGMAGAAQGWCEAPYMATEDNLHMLGSHAVRVPHQACEVYILPGVMQCKPANVMRGEETQILGLLADQPDFNGTICLPGTHTKWVRVLNGQIDSFTTCMTGEMFALLSEQSVLKHSMVDGGWDDEAFTTAVNQTISVPESVVQNLFSLRACLLLENQSSATARACLSGMLIGIELSATSNFWTDRNVVLIGESSLCQNYREALALLHVESAVLNAEAMTLQGLIKGFEQIERSTGNA